MRYCKRQIFGQILVVQGLVRGLNYVDYARVDEQN